MKRIIIVFIFFTLIIGCEKNEKTCNSENPIEELGWLKELKSSFTNCICEMSIIQATYREQTVFYSSMTDPLCDGYYPVILLDCNGTQVKTYEPNDPALATEISNREVLYRCKKQK
jgi:hypothetical protein